MSEHHPTDRADSNRYNCAACGKEVTFPLVCACQNVKKETKVEEVSKNSLLAAGLNGEDMQWDGRRSCFISSYGSLNEKGCTTAIKNIWKAWGVTDSFDIDVYTNGKPAACYSDSSRRFMMKFADGKWRYGSFGGINGAPMGSCWTEPFEGETGEVAYLEMLVGMRFSACEEARARLMEAERLYGDALTMRVNAKAKARSTGQAK